MFKLLQSEYLVFKHVGTMSGSSYRNNSPLKDTSKSSFAAKLSTNVSYMSKIDT